MRYSTERLAVTYLSRHPAAREDEARASPPPSALFSISPPIHLPTYPGLLPPFRPPSVDVSRRRRFVSPVSPLATLVRLSRPSPGLFNFRLNFLLELSAGDPRGSTARRLVASSPTQIKRAIDVEGSTRGARTVFVNNVHTRRAPVLRCVIERQSD